MSTDYDVVCRKCKVHRHLGQRFTSGFAFGFGSNDEEGRKRAGQFIEDHSDSEHKPDDLAIMVTDALPRDSVSLDYDFQNEAGDWGVLEKEPCRYCHLIGGVMFRVDDSPRGKVEAQVVRCAKCGRSWEVDSSMA